MSELKKKVKSSMMKYVEYNPLNEEMTITFTNNSVFVYKNVPFKEYMGLVRAPSIGNYFWKHIRDKYKNSKVK